jgi:peptide deformylase|tara:strand:+ start:500 stop:1066 length:567 start_codon:yes stop_codon:yes gene_type:complete
MKLVHCDDPILSKVLADVDIENPGFDIKETATRMKVLMNSQKGLGLSACQVGLDYKMFIMGQEANVAVFINPEVVSVSVEEEIDVEGCLSFPDMFVKIPRPTTVEAKWFDEDLQPQAKEFTGYAARCFLHEFDHLYGVVYKQKVSRLKWERAEKKKVKIQKQRLNMMKYMEILQKQNEKELAEIEAAK